MNQISKPLEAGRRLVSYLPRYDNGNGWYNILPVQTAAQELVGDVRADWLIIGAGYAGLSAARRLAELHPEARIAIVEADRVGRATAGRNAGMAIDHPFLSETNGSLERAHRIHRLHKAGIEMLDRQVKTHLIDCQWSGRGKYQVAVGDKARLALDHTASLLSELGIQFDLVDGSTLQRDLGTASYQAAIYTSGTHLMNPAALTRGLAGSLPPNVVLFEKSPVTSLTTGSTIKAETPRGTVRAKRAILATDGFTPAFGILSGRIINIISFAVLTEPLNALQQERLGGTRDWGVHPVGRAGATIRRTQDERIWYRTAFRYSRHMTCSDGQLQHYRAKVTASFHRRFPQLGDVRIAHAYSGGLSFSQNNEPFFARVEPNLFAVACQNAIGIAKGTIHGALMAEWASGGTSPLIDDVLSYGTPSKLPPEPFLGWGVAARLASLRITGRQE
ncbi:NAD(P)/FAD-dependent oxidoreductase [Mesorhizobium sp. 10J20-29]